MDQPLPLAHEERVGGGHGQIVHHLGVAAQQQALDDAPGAVGGADSVAERQVLRRHPAALVGEEGVLVGGLDRLRIDLEIDQHGVGADQQRRDRGAAGGLVGLVVGQRVFLPNSVTSAGRIKVVCANTIFFDINNANITIQAGVPLPNPVYVSLITRYA